MTSAHLSTRVTLRPMREQDISPLAAIHLAAFRGFPNARLGRVYARAMLRWFFSNPNGIAIVAERDQTFCGYVVGAPLGYQKAFARHMILPAILGYLTHPTAWANFRVLQSAWLRLRNLACRANVSSEPTIPTPAYSLVSIAVAPPFRGQRIGQALIHAFENAARARGAVAVRLTTRPENPAAIALYQTSGWQQLPYGRTLLYVKSLV